MAAKDMNRINRLSLLVLLAAVSTWAQAIPDMDLSGTWRMTAGDRVSQVTLPFSATSQPVGRYTLERTFTLPEGADRRDLALSPGVLRGNYQVFVNGQQVGGAGTLGSSVSPTAAPYTFAIPATAASAELAIRIEVDYATLPLSRYFDATQSRFSFPRPLISSRLRVEDAVRRAITGGQVQGAMNPVWAFTGFLFGVFIWLSRRSDSDASTFHWVVAAFVASAVFDTASSVSFFSPASAPEQVVYLIGRVALAIVRISNLEFAVRLVSWPRPPWRWLFYSAAFLVLLDGPRELYIGTTVNSWIFPLLHTAAFVTALRSRGRDVRLITGLLLFYELQVGLPIPALLLGPVQISHIRFVRWIFGVVMVLEMVRRSAANRRERERLAQELEAARQVQSLLIAPASGDTEGYEIDAAYLPAQEVGGDFYQVWRASDGSLLAAVGDVSGKGLKAAMTVSLLIGALRRETSSSPAEILRNLNGVLAKRRDAGFVTCCVVRLGGDGSAAVSSAGHPAPWWNGREMELSGALPLGVAVEAEFDEQHVALQAGDRLTLVSDGVVEAENAQGELFGFDRTGEISGKSAQEIAETAKGWGQNDDITVVTVTVAEPQV